jgi:hypothetical protein
MKPVRPTLASLRREHSRRVRLEWVQIRESCLVDLINMYLNTVNIVEEEKKLIGAKISTTEKKQALFFACS